MCNYGITMGQDPYKRVPGYDYQEQVTAYPKYNFGYEISEPHTGDFKSQQETRDGDKVEGFYTLLDADGYIRTVHYTSSKETGFLAQVTRTPSHVQQPQYQQQPLRPHNTIAPNYPIQPRTAEYH